MQQSSHSTGQSGQRPQSDSARARGRKPSRIGLEGAIAVAFIGLLFSLIAVYLAPSAIVEAHFEKVVYGAFGFGVIMLIGIFINKRGFTWPTRDIVQRKLPAGVAALVFVGLAEFWFTQNQEYQRLSKTLTEVCVKAIRPQFNTETEEARRQTFKTAQAINRLFIAPHRANVSDPCYP